MVEKMSEEVDSVHLRSKTPRTTILILINHKPVYRNGQLFEEKISTQNNKIITSKYTLLDFIPKNLFLQFRRIGNFYFLMTTIIQLLIDSPVSPATCFIPLSFVVIVTAIKQGYEDWLRHKADKQTNSRLLPLVSGQGTTDLTRIQSRDIRLGDIIQVCDEEEIPCDLLLLGSSQADGNCSITTANLDGETNLKRKVSTNISKRYKTIADLYKMKGIVECEEPNPDLYEFCGIITINDEKENLSADNLLLRGSRLINTSYVYGLAVYTGKDTKMSLNSKATHFKFSTLENSINIYLGIYLMLLLSFCIICLYFRYQIILDSDQILKEHWYLANVFFKFNNFNGQAMIYNFLNFFVLFNYLIPISLYVSLEMTRFIGSKLMIANKQFEGETKDDILICNCSDINEELGQIKYLFSDKTGTLTENVMKFVSCSINGEQFRLKDNVLYSVKQEEDEIREIKVNSLSQEQKFFFVCLALCNTVSIKKVKEKSSKQALKINRLDGKIDVETKYEYIADSPDEKALVEAASNLNIKLLSSNEKEVRISIEDKKFVYQKLKVIEFDTIRKRMSVLVRDPIGRVYLICKGADSELINLIKKGKVKEIYRDIDDFATIGLRTLTIAYRCLSNEELDEYLRLHNMALEDFANKKQKLDKSNKFLETNLTLLGATGIEDKLQEDVESTLAALKKAGIYIWLLTGDKLETAISVAFSCKLIEPEFHLLSLSRQKDIDSCRNCLIRFWYGIKNSINLEKYSFQLNLEEIEEKMNVAVKMANFLFTKLENYGRIDHEISKIESTLSSTSMDKTLSDRLHYECLNRLEAKIDGLIKLEDALNRLKMFANRKNQFTKKLKLRKINKQLNRDIGELEKIETCLNTNDYNLLLRQSCQSKPHLSIKKSETSSNIFDSLSLSLLQPSRFHSLMDGDAQNFDINEEIKQSSEISRYMKEKFVLILDGGSVYIALKYHLKLFELVCQHCAVVICSRMSPIQKAQIVRMVKNLPSKPITAAIGDGANDVSMIQEANVGFGVFGKEGTQAVRNSDFAFSKFRFVKTVLLVHGHYFYVRISHLVHFFFFKNMVFIMPQFIYSFYNMFSGQTLYHPMLLMCYNLLFTATPIFFHSIQNENIPRFFLAEYSTLYRTLSENACMNMNIIFKWISFSTVQGIFVFFSVKCVWPGTVSMFDNGKEIGIFAFGLIIYHIVVLIVNFKLLITSRNLKKDFVISLIGSTVSLPLFCLIYSSFKWNFLDDGMYGQYNQIFKSYSFWLTVVMITFFAILPDIIYSTFETSILLRNYKKLIDNKNKEKYLKSQN